MVQKNLSPCWHHERRLEFRYHLGGHLLEGHSVFNHSGAGKFEVEIKLMSRQIDKAKLLQVSLWTEIPVTTYYVSLVWYKRRSCLNLIWAKEEFIGQGSSDDQLAISEMFMWASAVKKRLVIN